VPLEWTNSALFGIVNPDNRSNEELFSRYVPFSSHVSPVGRTGRDPRPLGAGRRRPNPFCPARSGWILNNEMTAYVQ
jgi:hypothetical protein